MATLHVEVAYAEPARQKIIRLLINEVRRFKGREGVTTNQEVFELERTLKRDPILTTSHRNIVTDETHLYEFIDTKKAADILGIRMLDHVIIGESGHYSFADNGCLS